MDVGSYHGPAGMEQSPVAEAYMAYSFPWVILTDRRRRVREILEEHEAYDPTAIAEAIDHRLKIEPAL